MDDPTLPTPDRPGLSEQRVADLRDEVLDAINGLTMRGLPIDSPDLRDLLAVTISLNGKRSHRAVMAEKRAQQIADDVLGALRDVGVTFLLAERRP